MSRPTAAISSSVCSVGNVPLAAVLWSGGISFAGVMAFIFADLIVLPILAIYRKYYGTRFALRVTALMFVTMVAAALVIDVVFGVAGLIPGGARPTRTDIFGSIAINYRLGLNLAGLAIFAGLFALTVRRGGDRSRLRDAGRPRQVPHGERGGRTYHFCSEHCLHALQADPSRYLGTDGRPVAPAHAGHRHGPAHAHTGPERSDPSQSQGDPDEHDHPMSTL
jgi:hypothetical protein